MTYYLNGVALPEGADFTINGFTYPYSWLEGTSPSLRASLGIEATGDITFDQKYYINAETARPLDDREELDDDGNPAYIQVWDPTFGEKGGVVDTDKRLVYKGLKTTCTEEIKDNTHNTLKLSDHYIIRSEVEGSEIPTGVSTYRAAVIAESDRVTAAISAVTTVEELIGVMNSVAWPKAD